MNYKLIRKLFTFGMLFTPIISFADNKTFNLTPYGGIDFGMQSLGFKPGYGDNLFAQRLPNVNIFAGFKLNDYLGIDGGYESTIEKKKNVTINGADQYLGMSPLAALGIVAGETAKFYTRTKIAGWHINIAGYYHTYTDNNEILSLIGSIGIKKTKVKLVANSYEINNLPDYLTHILNTNNTKNVARITGGLQYFFNKHVGVRAIVTWENIATITPSVSNKPYTVKLKNSISYSIGFMLKNY